MELWSWDLYECSGGTISGLGWLSIHVSTILYFMLMICYTYRSSASEKCNNCKTLTEVEQYQQSWERSHVQYVTARPICIYCSSAGHGSTSGYSAQSNCDPLSCRSAAPSPASDILGVILIICTLLWWIGTGLILINIFTFTPFLWKPCGGTKLKFQERSQ